MTSSLLRIRSERPCSPSAQRRASARLDLPEPLGPTIALTPGPELDEGPLREGLEALDPEAQQAGGRRHAVVSSATRRIDGRGVGRASGRSGAARRPRREPLGAQDVERLGRGRGLRDPPGRTLAHAEDAAVHEDLDLEPLLVIGAHGLDEVVDGPLAGRPLGVLLEPALGALERRHRRGPRRSPARRARGSSRGPSPSRGRGRWRRRAPRTRRRAATGGPGRHAGPRPRRAAGTTRARGASRGGRARACSRSPRGARTGRPRRRRDGAR